jgi:hypothetical protein
VIREEVLDLRAYVIFELVSSVRGERREREAYDQHEIGRSIHRAHKRLDELVPSRAVAMITARALLRVIIRVM